MPSSPSTPPEHTEQPASSEEAAKTVQDTIHRIGDSLKKQRGDMNDMKDKLGEVLENSSSGLGNESGEALESCNAVFDALKLQLENIMVSDTEGVSPEEEGSGTGEKDVPARIEGAHAEVQDAQTRAEDL